MSQKQVTSKRRKFSQFMSLWVKMILKFSIMKDHWQHLVSSQDVNSFAFTFENTPQDAMRSLIGWWVECTARHSPHNSRVISVISHRSTRFHSSWLLQNWIAWSESRTTIMSFSWRTTDLFSHWTGELSSATFKSTSRRKFSRFSSRCCFESFECK